MAGRGAEAYRKRLERAARLKAAGTAEPAGYKLPEGLGASESEEAQQKKRRISEAQKADYLIRDAMNRGEFDNLRYAGKPIPGLDDPDPDWWIKRLIKRENISGLGPPALLLRVEDKNFEGRLDELPSERQVRDAVEDFNLRVIDARRQLQGGPPVITKLRNVDEEVLGWRARRGMRAGTTEEGSVVRFVEADESAVAGKAQQSGLRSWVRRMGERLRARLPGPQGNV
ncbi:DUF1992 domain-containing protein [Arthrobacter gengyunqii]|uniref:DUF1992 domain-containing protein n=1 Tax=Arthrobacter gengyunqii TaxID=2886940 RepID=A0A9X1M1Z4_9MICC|nr:DUF1992 domain-containing protein [Arthrobacter gengyunqii]MCC3269853.1 DUF1992 domain-containing protein [Arthrobacter gengyunqii]UOY97297.1 DUF1992 domain-containing protein [Arthrobacter gengyunqii]